KDPETPFSVLDPIKDCPGILITNQTKSPVEASFNEMRLNASLVNTSPVFITNKDTKPSNGINGMKIVGLSPYWFDVAQGSALHNMVVMRSLLLLTGPDGGGKSRLLRSIGAAALLAICGVMVPAESALIPHFDSIMLHMKSYDSPADGKSSFQLSGIL
ncbi:DNA mismatch repair protein MutS, C-terminal, partial [Dillenia turbinata]